MLDHFQFNTHSEIYSRRFASIYRSLRTIYDPSDALAQEPDIEEKVLRNARLAHALNFRWAQVAGRKWSVAPAEEGEPEEAVLAKIVLQGMGKIRRFTNARKMLARADFSGARFAEVRKEVIWAPFGDGKMRRWVVPVMLKDIPKERFRWQRTEGTKTSVHLEVFDLQNDAWTKVPKSAPLIRHVYDDSEETLGYGRGLREALYFCWYAISHIHRERIDAVERFGQGRLVLKLAGEKDASIGSSNATIRDRALATLAKMKSRHEFVIGQGDDLEQLDGSMTGHEMMSALTKEIEDSAVQLILGSVLPTGGGADVGSNARAQVEQESTDVLIQTCGDMLEESVSDGIAGPFLTDNYANLREMGLDGVPAPKFTILRGGHGDPLQNAQRIQIAMATGLKVKRSEAYDLVELTEPGEDDDVLEPPQQPGIPPGGGMPGEDPGAGGDPSDPQAGGDEQQQGDPEGGGDSQPLPGADDEIPEPDAVALAEWREEDHPRGQPGNAGEFGPGGGKTTKGKARSSHTGATTSAHASPGPALDAAWYYKQPRDVQIAVQVYTGDAENTVAPAMNRALIAGRGEADPETGASASLMLARARRVNSAADAHPAWPEPHVLYRGIGRSGDFVTRARASIGKTLRLPGMQSTSEDPTKALEFAKNGGALLAITSRNGLPIQNLSVHVDEREVILGHDWKYRITKVEDGKTPTIHMEVVEPHGAAHALAEWDESKHPRGQPDNKGEFASTPGGGSPKEEPKDAPQAPVGNRQRDPRLPAVGTKIIKKWRGLHIEAEVLENGFKSQHSDTVFRSLSALAFSFTKVPVNGFLFFGLIKRGEKKPEPKEEPKTEQPKVEEPRAEQPKPTPIPPDAYVRWGTKALPNDTERFTFPDDYDGGLPSIPEDVLLGRRTLADKEFASLGKAFGLRSAKMLKEAMPQGEHPASWARKRAAAAVESLRAVRKLRGLGFRLGRMRLLVGAVEANGAADGSDRSGPKASASSKMWRGGFHDGSKRLIVIDPRMGDSGAGITYHEFGHAMHAAASPVKYRKNLGAIVRAHNEAMLRGDKPPIWAGFPPGSADAIAADGRAGFTQASPDGGVVTGAHLVKHNRYAITNPNEFVAEVFRWKCQGHDVSPTVAKWYAAFGGATQPNRGAKK